MSFIKYPLPESVLQATEQRIQWVMDNFSRICVSFSGGKDSTVMLHLTAQAARLQGKKICVLFIDWEAQFSCTIAHCEKLRALYADVIETFYWVALPLTTLIIAYWERYVTKEQNEDSHEPLPPESQSA